MKKITSLLLAFFLLLCLAGCGGANNADQSSDLFSDLTDTSANEATSSESGETDSTTASDTDSTPSKAQQNGNSSANKGSSAVNTSQTSSKRYPKAVKTFSINRNNNMFFKTVGRCVPVKSTQLGLGLYWSCSSIEFDVDCIGDLALYFTRTGSNYMAVRIFVDGKPIADRTRIERNDFITIAEGLEAGIHRIKILRLTDCEAGTLVLSRIKLQGFLVEKAPAYNKLYIEAMGDANLIGWGVLLEDDYFKNYEQKIARSKEYVDGSYVYTYVAAQKLNADSYTLAIQGAGIACTYHTTTKTPDGETAPNNALIGNQRLGQLPLLYYRQYSADSLTEPYRENRAPDVIVIDAGKADLSTKLQGQMYLNGTVGGTLNDCIDITTRFFRDLRAKNPKAKIIWCTGLDGKSDAMNDYMNLVMKIIGGEKNDFYTLTLPAATRHNQHASKKDYENCANLLVNKIKQIL